MVTPRYDQWTVSGSKPADRALFDSLIPRPFQSIVSRLTGRGQRSTLIYETFATEEEARRFAGTSRAAGAVNVTVSPPRDKPRPPAADMTGPRPPRRRAD